MLSKIFFGYFMTLATIKATHVFMKIPRSFCPILTKFGFFDSSSSKSPMSNFADNRPVGAALSTCAQTDRLTKVIGALSEDANAPKNDPFVKGIPFSK
jgi:hypothetical protein